ncbi:hypothetical protein GP486_008060 [Trichoglossum hirsutum]|uniref:Inositolphosphotransferase Aur1/Ipt1 domain-containing protein n=1 Tax=Trichoglossum hirsutum TaxID=265104 RepID=A0A9P8IAL0_9PEZI|nr:hypothetical protein GP486_008060 [Trichoglossum hirsutum]
MLDNLDSCRSSDELLPGISDGEDDAQEQFVSTKRRPKRRNCCGTIVYTPNSSRFANHLHSRLLQKFPFLIEMFYWIINYTFYRCTSIASQRIFSKTGIWDVAQDHGLTVLEFEQFSWAKWFFLIRELDFQQWFMDGHQTALTVLNRAYALIHIPGTVGFIGWYYCVAPSHAIFAVVRRTITLTNFLAFSIFILYPCMPPRLLPPQYGFLDSVRHDDAQSVWMSGKYVNALAAMPSMHFGYAFSIGCTLIYHSGAFRRHLRAGEARKSVTWRMFYVLFGALYPTLVLITIVATANHYWLDATVATCCVVVSFFCNRIFLIFLPLEDLLLWALRLEKPTPSTGSRYNR